MVILPICVVFANVCRLRRGLTIRCLSNQIDVFFAEDDLIGCSEAFMLNQKHVARILLLIHFCFNGHFARRHIDQNLFDRSHFQPARGWSWSRLLRHRPPRNALFVLDTDANVSETLVLLGLQRVWWVAVARDKVINRPERDAHDANVKDGRELLLARINIRRGRAAPVRHPRDGSAWFQVLALQRNLQQWSQPVRRRDQTTTDRRHTVNSSSIMANDGSLPTMTGAGKVAS